MIKVSVINKVTLESMMKQINPKIKNASAVLINEIQRVSEDFTPYLSGDMFDSRKREMKGDDYIGISYNTPYARRIWYGDPNWNYTKPNPENNETGHSQACPRWIIRSFEVHKNDIMTSVVEAFNEV